MGESGGVPIPGETALIAGAVLASHGKLQIELVIAIAAAGGDRRRQHRLPDRAQGRALAARAAGALPAPAPRGAARRASRSSNATARRRCSSDASCSACACGPRGWPARRACTGARSSLWNALGGISLGDARSACSPTSSASSAGNAIEAFGLYGLVAAVIAVARRVRRCIAVHRAPQRRTQRGESRRSSTMRDRLAEPEGDDEVSRPPAARADALGTAQRPRRRPAR